MDDNFERRFSTLAPRVLGDDEIKDAKKGQPVLSGHCARFFDPADADGTQFMLAKNLVERINPHAFDEAITSNADCVALFNHDQNQLLARRAAGTLHLAVDRQGLRYTISPNRVLAPFLIESVRRGDLRGASFAFTVNSQRFVAGTGGGPDIREILSCSLHDISVVASPAYAATSVSVNLRSVHGYAQWQAARAAHVGSGTPGAVTFSHDSSCVIDDDGSWDENIAMERVRGWASTGDGIDHSMMTRAFAYSSGGASESAHVLLHHDVRSGKLHCHLGAVRRCLRMLDDMDDDDDDVPFDHRASVRSHLERHLSRADDADDDDDGERSRRSMRRRLDEADAESRQLEFAEKRRQLDRVEADMRQPVRVHGLPVSDELWKRAEAINRSMWNWEKEPLGMGK